MERGHLHDVPFDRPDLQAQCIADLLHRGGRGRAGGPVAIVSSSSGAQTMITSGLDCGQPRFCGRMRNVFPRAARSSSLPSAAYSAGAGRMIGSTGVASETALPGIQRPDRPVEQGQQHVHVRRA